jgi:hypothetical protein
VLNFLEYFRPRFSLRTLFIVMTVCCWLSYTLIWIWRRHDALAHLHIGVYAGPAGFTFNNAMMDPHRLTSEAVRNVSSPWNLRLFGEPGVATISVYGPDHTAIAENFRRLFPEATVDSADSPPPTAVERHAQMRKQMEAFLPRAAEQSGPETPASGAR